MFLKATVPNGWKFEFWTELTHCRRFSSLKCFLEYIPQNVLRIKHVLRLKFGNIGFYRGELDFSSTEPFRGFFFFFFLIIVIVQEQACGEQWGFKAYSGNSSPRTPGTSSLKHTWDNGKRWDCSNDRCLKNNRAQGHLAISVNRVYDFWSWVWKFEPHATCRDYLKSF